MSWLLNTFGSKKLVAIVGGVLAVLLVPVLNAKLGLALDPGTLRDTFVAIAGPVLAYVVAQWHIDVKSDGRTTTAYQLTQAIAAAAAGSLPSNTIAAKVAAEVLAELRRTDDGSAPPVPPQAAG